MSPLLPQFQWLILRPEGKEEHASPGLFLSLARQGALGQVCGLALNAPSLVGLQSC